MNEPSASDIQGWTELAALKAAATQKAERLTAIAISMFKRVTGRSDFSQIADQDAPIVNHAVQGLAEMLTFQSAPEYLEALSDFDLIASFNAGPYSETRRGPREAHEARLLVAWPWLSDLLWQLLTPDQYSYWTEFFANVNPPAFDVTEVDWAAGQDMLGGSYQGDWYGSGGHIWGA